MPGDVICMRVGDRRPVLRVKLGLKGAPDLNPLTGALNVYFRMVNPKTGAVKIDNVLGSIESVPDRIVSYTWGPTDTVVDRGRYHGLFVVDYGGGIVQTFPPCDSDVIIIDIE